MGILLHNMNIIQIKPSEIQFKDIFGSNHRMCAVLRDKYHDRRRIIYLYRTWALRSYDNDFHSDS